MDVELADNDQGGDDHRIDGQQMQRANVRQ
jgi:hypothetical protein